jgi:hypothetical protein
MSASAPVAAVLRAAPNVLHHAGPLAGAAIPAGATSQAPAGVTHAEHESHHR